MKFLKKLYGKHYDLHPLFVEPKDVGHHGVARSRVYIIMVHRESVTQIYDCHSLYQEIANAMKLFVATRPSDYFIADAKDIRLEAERTARSRKIPVRQKAPQLNCNSFD